MARPDVARRIKSYSAATGYVYQYYFFEVIPAEQGQNQGNAYVYVVSADRKLNFVVRIVVRSDAVARWEKWAGRRLSGTEEYAVAKMRLFREFDESEDLPKTLQGAIRELIVDDSNLNELLAQLDL